MFQMTVVFGPTSTTWAFLFKTREAADAAYLKLGTQEITDDFGQCAHINGEIHAALIEDLELAVESLSAKSIHNMHVQLKVQEAVMADPKLQTFMRMQNLRNGAAVGAGMPIVSHGAVPRM